MIYHFGLLSYSIRGSHGKERKSEKKENLNLLVGVDCLSEIWWSKSLFHAVIIISKGLVIHLISILRVLVDLS